MTDAIQFDPLAGAIYTRTMHPFVGMAFPIWFALTFGLLYVGFRIGYVIWRWRRNKTKSNV